jgi:pimeloyl-ACP methyl ester carboxylesterase
MEHPTKVDVGSYQLAYQSFGSGQPTVVFESGSECGAESLAMLARAIEHQTRAVIYDRAGLGQSDPAPKPRTVEDAVADLHRLLHSAQLGGPYLLVAHSLGGWIARLFAHTYRHEVAGLMLLDSSHPEQTLRQLGLMPAPSPAEPAALSTMRVMLEAEWADPFDNSEGFDIAASAAQVRAADSLGTLPLVVISAGKDEWDEGFPPELARAMEEDWMQMQRELVALSTNSTHLIAAESSHAIQDCQPELVIEQIRRLVAHIRESSPLGV